MKTLLALTSFSCAVMPLCSAQSVVADWNTNTLGSSAMTFTAVNPTVPATFDFSVPQFSAAPLGMLESSLDYSVSEDWTASFAPAVDNLRLYCRFWRGAGVSVDGQPITYTFDQVPTLLSGFASATFDVTGLEMTLPASGFHGGILEFPGTTSSLACTPSSNVSCCSSQLLTFAIPVDIDDCADAFLIEPGAHVGSTMGSTGDGMQGCGAADNTGDVWYQFAAPSDGTLKVNTCGTHDAGGIDSGIDTVLALLDGCGGSVLACSDNEGITTECAGLDAGLVRDSAVSTVMTSGQVVLINVSSQGATPDGSFLMNLSFEPVGGLAFSEFCNGDGGDQMGCSDCPCTNNAPAGTIGGCLNSAGTGSRLIASGDPSVSLAMMSTDDLRFSATSGPAFQLFILNSGNDLAPNNPANPCFGLGSGLGGALFDGLRCVVSGTLRNGGRGADANGEVGVTGPAWGGESNPPGGIAQFFGYASGTTKYFQAIHRDDPTVNCMTGLNTTQAIEVMFTP